MLFPSQTPTRGVILACVTLYWQMLEDVPQITNGVQLSIVQGYMAKFYRLLLIFKVSILTKIFISILSQRGIVDDVNCNFISGNMEHG